MISFWFLFIAFVYAITSGIFSLIKGDIEAWREYVIIAGIVLLMKDNIK